MTFVPHIAVVPRCGDDFSIEVRHDNEGDWETYFNGHCLEAAKRVINLALKHHPTYRVRLVDWQDRPSPLSGFVFNIIRTDKVERFFRTCNNPFYNRKVYQSNNPKATVSFDMIGEPNGEG